MTIRLDSDTERAVREMKESALRAFETGEYQGEYFTYSTVAQLFETFSVKRWALIEKLLKIGPTSLRGLARAVGRDVKRVHQDVAVLLKEGIVERNSDKKLFVPFESIHLEATMEDKSAAA